MQNNLDTLSWDFELRETARWAASITLLLGYLLPDDFDLTRLVGDDFNRGFYASRLSGNTMALVNERSNYVLREGVRCIDLSSMTTAGQLIDSIASHLVPNQFALVDRSSTALPLLECEPDDTMGAL